MTLKKVMQEAYQAGLPPRAIADRLIRICGIDAVSAEKLVSAFFATQKAPQKRV